MPADGDMFNPSEIKTIKIAQPDSTEFSPLDDDNEVWQDK